MGIPTGLVQKVADRWLTKAQLASLQPAKSSPLWGVAAGNETGGLVEMMEDGYVRPVS